MTDMTHQAQPTDKTLRVDGKGVTTLGGAPNIGNRDYGEGGELGALSAYSAGASRPQHHHRPSHATQNKAADMAGEMAMDAAMPGAGQLTVAAMGLQSVVNALGLLNKVMGQDPAQMMAQAHGQHPEQQMQQGAPIRAAQPTGIDRGTVQRATVEGVADIIAGQKAELLGRESGKDKPQKGQEGRGGDDKGKDAGKGQEGGSFWDRARAEGQKVVDRGGKHDGKAQAAKGNESQERNPEHQQAKAQQQAQSGGRGGK